MKNILLDVAQNFDKMSDSEKAEVNERVQTDIIGVQTATQSTEISRIVLKGILDKYFENVPDDIKADTELTAKAEYGGIIMKVSDIYSGEIVERYMAADIANASQKDKQSLYGSTVTGYILPSETKTDVSWNLFYADNNNIYLIASDYIERNNIPNSTTDTGNVTTNKPNEGDSSYTRSAYFTNILKDYVGSSRITDNRLKSLNNDYFNIKNYSSTNKNMKAVAYMMDTTAWNRKFLDSSKADYAIGGPTVEILFKSYNDKYGTSYLSEATSEIGYSIKKQESDDWTNNIAGGIINQNNNMPDQLYVKSDKSKANAMWLASPSAFSDYHLGDVDRFCNIAYYAYAENNLGFRPLVCLKSNTQLQKTGDTTYQIK